MDLKKNTTIEFEFYDGTTAAMTLTFYALYQLKSKNKSLYERYNRIMSKGPADELEMITVMYTAYVCAHLDDAEIMSEVDFMILCGSDRKAIQNAFVKLTQPKKQKASDNRSETEPVPGSKE